MVHVGLLAPVGLAIPANTASGLQLGEYRRSLSHQVEQALRARLPASRLLGQVCPALLPDGNVDTYRPNYYNAALPITEIR